MDQDNIHMNLWIAVKDDQSKDNVAECIAKGANVDYKHDSYFGQTALHHAARNGNLEITKTLLSYGADPMAKDITGWTPLHLAADNGKTEICKQLIASGSDCTARDNKEQTPLHLAARFGNTETCKLLISSGSDLTARDVQGWTTLHFAAWYGKTTACKLLISSGSDLTARDIQGRTPLHLAARLGNTNTCELLISSGSDCMARDDQERTPLHLEAMFGNTETCKLLISSGSDLTSRDAKGWAPLHLAAAYGFTETCKQLISSGSDLSAKDARGQTPLHVAASNDRVDTTETLISLGADPMERDNQGKTPLHVAASNDGVHTIETLMSVGADTMARDNQDWTPLHYAVVRGRIETVKLLLIHGADITATTKEVIRKCITVRNQGGIKIYHTVVIDLKYTNEDILGKDTIECCRRNTHISFSRDVPPEVHMLSSTDSETFGNILKSGFYRSHVGKILIVGHEAVGKTAISNVLVGKIPSKKRVPTEGIDVHIYQATIDLENKKWIPSELDIEDVAYRNLMVFHKFTETELSVLETEESDNSAEKGDIENETDVLEKNSKMSTDKQELTIKTKQKSIPYRILKIFRLKKKEKQLLKQITTESLFKETVERSGKVMGVDRNLMPVNIMDFGGQYVFYSTHQSFLTYRGFYILPVNGSLDFDEEIKTESLIPGRFGRPTSRDFVLFWVGSITSCSVGASTQFPKIFVALTHRDRIASEEEAIKRAKYIFAEIRKMFQNSEAMAHLILEPELFINAMDPKDPDYRRLENTIVDHVCGHPTWGEKLPKAWIPLELALQQNIENGEKVMSIDALRAVNKENPVQVLTERELHVFLKMAHTQGEVIFFPLPGLKDNIILSPSFFVECLRSLVTESSFCSGKRRNILESVKRNGVLRIEDIHRLWRKKKELFAHKDHLISVMSHLDILASPRKYNKGGDIIREDYFYVPSLVKASDENVYSIDHQGRCIGLSFKFSSPVIPPAIGYRLIASCIDLYEVKHKDGRAMLFSEMAVLAVKRNLDLVVVLRNDRVDIYLIHNKTRSNIVADTAVGIADCIRDILVRIVDSFKIMAWGSNMKILDSQAFTVEYPCLNMKSPCYNAKIEDWTCKCGHDIKREIYSKWTIDRKKITCGADCTGFGEEGLCEKPSELQLAKLALQFAWEGQYGLKELLLYLGLRENEMQAIEVDSNGNNLNTRFLSLRKWRQKLDGTIGDICKAMNETGNDLHWLCRMNRDRFLGLPAEALQKKIPSDKELDAISAEVINESLLLAVQLEIPVSTWQQMKTDSYKIVNINREVLGKWRTETKEKNKMRELAQALCNVDISITSILQHL